MASLSKYFIQDESNLLVRNDCIVFGNNYRFSVLTERLIRLEYSPSGKFEDRASELVINRNFPKPNFTYQKNKGILEIKTRYFTLNYLENKPFKGSKVTPGNTLNIKLNNTNNFWYYNHPEAKNIPATTISLDDFNDKLNKGLFSLDGFASIDDSKSLVIDNDQYVPRNNDNIDIYVFLYNKDFGSCLKDYFALTGKPSLIPRYALGTWWYKNEAYNTEDILQIKDNYHTNNLPLSVILLGDKLSNRAYNINQNLIPDIDSLIKNLNNSNIKLGLTIKPDVLITPDDENYNTVKNALNITKDKDISLLPFDNTKLGIYFKLYIKKLMEKGIDIFYIDYLNYKDINSLWLLNHYHYAIGNSEIKRNLILSRNASIAAHRYPILFSGKTKVSWETLNYLPFYNSQSSNIGISFWAHAIGGYCDGIEDKELYIRYIEFATYSPIFIIASEAGKYYKREPWIYDMGSLKIIEEYMNTRNKLIPYIYSESYNYYENGIPLIQPLYYKNPEIYDEPIYKNEYYFGKNFLIAPITKKKDLVMNRVVQRLFIPKGTWYDFKTGKKFKGGKYYVSFYKDEDYPVFCKAGSIIPLSLNSQEISVPTDMEIHIFPGESGQYNLYEDDGITNLYKEGYILNTSIEYNYLANNYTLIMRPVGGKTGIICDARNYKIRFRNTKKADEVIVYIDNEKQENINTYTSDTDFIIEINDVKTTSQLTINCKGKDIEIDAVRLINEDISSILMDLEIKTHLKEKIDAILFSDLTIKKKRIEIRKLKNAGLDKKFIKMFIKLLEYISEI